MPVSEAETISALRVLLNSSKEILQSHRDLTLQTLEQVRSVLAVKSHNNKIISSDIQAEPLPFYNNENLENHSPRQSGESSYSPARVFEDRSHAAADPNEIPRTTETERNHDADPEVLDASAQANTKKRKRKPDIETRLAKLLKAIEKHLPKFVEFSQNTASLFDLLDNDQGRGSFYMLLDHIKRIDGNKTPNEKEKLLKGLCQVSLAREFTAWERERGWSSRVDQLYSQICGSEVQRFKKRKGKISQYLRDIRCCDTDQSVANKALCQGTIQLLFKRLIEEALGDSAPKEVAGGLFSVVAVFEFHQFQLLAVEELPHLIDFLIPKDAHLSPGDYAHNHRSLRSSLHSVKEAAAWSESLQSDFESYCRANCLVMRGALYQSEAQAEKDEPPKANTTQLEQILPSNGLDRSIPTSTEDRSQMVFSGNLNEPLIPGVHQPSCTNEYLGESHGFGDNSTGGSLLATTINTPYSVLHQDQRTRRFDTGRNQPGTFQSTWTMGEVTTSLARTLPHVQSQTITNDVNQAVQPEPGTIESVHPSAFPQFILPSSIDTIIPSTSPQFYLPRSMDVETDMQYPDYFPGTVDTMIASNFPHFTPYAATHSTTAQNDDNGNVRTDTASPNCPIQAQRFGPYTGAIETLIST